MLVIDGTRKDIAVELLATGGKIQITRLDGNAADTFRTILQ